MDEDRERRAVLGAFLRARRQRIRPEDVGLPAGIRRRTPGLRREEVAVLAGVSPSWYAYLEQGRPINPSSAVLDSLSGVMGLTPPERRYFYELAQGSEPSAADHQVPPDDWTRHTAMALVQTLSDFPYPVYCVEARGDVLAANSACPQWFDGLVVGENVMRWTFLSAAARESFVHWEREARTVLAAFRALLVSPAVRAEARPLITELSASSPEFREWWQSHEVYDQTSRTRSMAHPTFGRHELRLSMFRAADDASVSVVLHHPHPETAPGAPPVSLSPEMGEG